MNHCKKLLVIFSFLLSGQVFAQSDATIVAIRKEYNRINSLKLNKEHFEYEKAGCVEGGKADYFFEDKNIVKITESGSIGDGSWTSNYYYRAGKPVFCFQTTEGGPAEGDAVKMEYRIYIKDGRAYRVLEGSKVINDENISKEEIQRANNFYKAYASKKFADAVCY